MEDDIDSADALAPALVARAANRRMNIDRGDRKQHPGDMASRHDDLLRFYHLLSCVEQRFGTLSLASCNGRMNWPRRGVYFFFEPGEQRTDTGSGSRVVRVGTHALKAGSRTHLWNRLSQHRGQTGGGGNHRGSIFRLLIGESLLCRSGQTSASWGRQSSAPRDIRENEHAHECNVSRTLGEMPFLYLAIDDEPGPGSLRGNIERNSIALLSNYERDAIDPASSQWLGQYSERVRVRRSGLWNSNHVDETYNPAFLDRMADSVEAMIRP